ncbi:recombinase family protein, partial [Chloroflexota bacterium]
MKALQAFTIIRVSGEDQLRGYGPDSQWVDDVVPNAVFLHLTVSESLRRVIQERATSWDREKFEAAVREGMDLYQRGVVQAVIFPRVDRETRFIFGSFPLLCEIIRAGMRVYFGRERFELNPNDNESVARYLRKAEEAQAYVETTRLNTIRGRRRRAEQDHMMPTARSKWAHDYHPYRRDWGKMPDATSGRFTVNAEKAVYVRQWAEWILIDGYSTNRCCGFMLSKYGIKIGRSTITNVLSDPAMLGKFYAYRNKDIRSPNSRRKVVKTEEKDWLLIYEDPLQSVLSPEQYYALKEKFQRNRENSSRNTKRWYPPLRSLIFCSCGSTMVGVFIGRKEHGYPSYRCLACGRYQRAIPLWEEIKVGIKRSLLDPERLIPAIKDQLESGQAITQLEEKQKANQVQLDNLDQASQKALRVHISLPNYPIEKLEAEELRIEENRKEIKRDQERLKRQIDELMQAIVNEEGVRRFCEIATGNLDSLNDEQWRVLLETMKVKIFVNDSGITVKLAVPSTKEETSVIAANTSRCLFNGNKF